MTLRDAAILHCQGYTIEIDADNNVAIVTDASGYVAARLDLTTGYRRS